MAARSGMRGPHAPKTPARRKLAAKPGAPTRATKTATSARGPSPGKRALIMAAATEEFLDKGFADASMDRIARRAGVSKVTVYAHFRAKADLFGALIAAAIEENLSPLHDRDALAGDPRATLERLADILAERMFTPRGLRLYRVVVAESPRFPDLGQAFYAAGPGTVITRLAGWLDQWSSEGKIKVTAPRQAAEDFYGLLRGDLHMRMLLGIDTPSRATATKTRAARRAVDNFWRLYGV